MIRGIKGYMASIKNYFYNLWLFIFKTYLEKYVNLILEHFFTIAIFFFLTISSLEISNMMKNTLLNKKTTVLNKKTEISDKIQNEVKTENTDIVNEKSNSPIVFDLLNVVYKYNHKTTWIDDFIFDITQKNITFTIYSIDMEGIFDYIRFLLANISQDFFIFSIDISNKRENLGTRISADNKIQNQSLLEFVRKKQNYSLEEVATAPFDTTLLKKVYSSQLIIEKKDKK